MNKFFLSLAKKFSIKSKMGMILILSFTSMFAFGIGFFGLKGIVAEDTVNLYFVPGSLEMPPGGVLSLMLDSGAENIGFVRVTVNFDNTKVQLTSEIVPTPNLGTVIELTSMPDANASGSATIVLGLSPGDTPPTGVFELAQIPITSISVVDNDATTFDIDTDVQIVNVSEFDLLFTTDFAILTLNPVNTSPTPTPTPTLTPTLTPIPTATPAPSPIPGEGSFLSFGGNSQAFVGENYDINILFSTDTEVSGVDAVILFDENVLSATSVSENPLISDTTQISIDNDLGVIRISQLAGVEEGFVGNGLLATISFDPLSIADSQFSFDFLDGATDDSNSISSADGTDILNASDPFLFSVVEHASLTISLSTPSINGDDLGGGISTEDGSWSFSFTTDINGLSEAIQLPDSLLGQNIDLLINVDGFLREREAVTVVGTIDLNLGLLRAGDLNNDGIVNNLDLSLMYDVWFGTGVADYNQDGIVNSADHWILTNNFFEEDE